MFRECHKSYSKFKTLFAWKWEGSVCESLIDTMEVNESLNESFEIVLWPEWSPGMGGGGGGGQSGEANTERPCPLYCLGRPPRQWGGRPVRALCWLLLKNVWDEVVFNQASVPILKHTWFADSVSAENTVNNGVTWFIVVTWFYECRFIIVPTLTYEMNVVMDLKEHEILKTQCFLVLFTCNSAMSRNTLARDKFWHFLPWQVHFRCKSWDYKPAWHDKEGSKKNLFLLKVF